MTSNLLRAITAYLGGYFIGKNLIPIFVFTQINDIKKIHYWHTYLDSKEYPNIMNIFNVIKYALYL